MQKVDDFAEILQLGGFEFEAHRSMGSEFLDILNPTVQTFGQILGIASEAAALVHVSFASFTLLTLYYRHLSQQKSFLEE